jgi:aminoglycoside 6'-N-acetyltransferase
MQDASFEQLRAERLILRRFAAEDAEALAAYRSDVEVARLQDWECPYPVGEASRFIASMATLAPGTPGTWFQFAVSVPPSPRLVGDVALHTPPSDARQAELGFTFARSHQGRGYAAEAVRTVVAYAFARLEMHRVSSRTDARNRRAQRLLERLSFRREGELREGVWFKDEWTTEILYAQLASEWRRPTA